MKKNALVDNVLPPLVCISMLMALAAALLYAPTEKVMGDTQRIFYFHVPAAISAFVCFFLVFIGSVQYLRTRYAHWDRLALCAAELGVLFGLIVLVTGPLWAKPIWGVYWRWEPRLTSMLIAFSIYVAYLMVRTHGASAGQAPRLAAVLGVMAFINVPLVYYSVDLWAADQQLHPQRNVGLEPEMRYALWMCFAAFFLLLSLLLKRRLELAKVEEAVEKMRQRVAAGMDH